MKKKYIVPEISEEFDVITSMLCSSQATPEEEYDPDADDDGTGSVHARGNNNINVTPSASPTYTEQAEQMFGSSMDNQ